MRSQPGLVTFVQVAGRNDYIRVHIVAELMYLTFCYHTVTSLYRSRVGNIALDRRGGSHSGRGQVNLRLRVTHTAHKVSV